MSGSRSKKAKIDVRVKEGLKQRLQVQATADGVDVADIVRKYLEFMANAVEAGQATIGSPSLPPPEAPASEGPPPPLNGVMLDQLCQPRDVVIFLQATEGVIHIAAPWSRAKTISCVSVDVIRRAWAALDRVRREGDSGPHAIGLRGAVSAQLSLMQLCFREMKQLRNPGQPRERVETTLALAENVLRAAADDILGVGEAVP